MAYTSDSGTSWIYAVCARLNVPAVDQVVTAMRLWAASEGMPDWAYNWLATERGGYGGNTYNSVGVWAYPDFATGVRATADTIAQSNMRGILDALRSGLILAIFEGINGSPWCGGCQGGRYPVALADYLDANAVPTTPPQQEATTIPSWDWSGQIHDTATLTDVHATRVDNALRALRGL